MTTIIYHKDTLYSDSLATHTMWGKDQMDQQYQGYNKIFQGSNAILGFSGTMSAIHEFMSQWVRNILIKDIKVYDYISAIIVLPDKVLYIDTVYKDPKWKVWKTPKYELVVEEYNKSDTLYIAIGSGRKFATEAFGAGWNPENCIRWAGENDPYTNLDVKSLKYKNNLKIEPISGYN
jgi:hypothetical protein